MEKIKTQAKKLSEKNNWIRKETEKLMKEWAEISQCNEDISCQKTILCSKEIIGGTLYYYLVSGSIEIKDQFGGDMYETDYWYSILPISKLRQVITNLPKAIDEIIKQMAEKQKQNDEILQFFKKMNTEI